MKDQFWYCSVCQAQNHEIDGKCQYCDCQGSKCLKDNCSSPDHFLQWSETDSGLEASSDKGNYAILNSLADQLLFKEKGKSNWIVLADLQDIAEKHWKKA